jgi:hypothetical protein
MLCLRRKTGVRMEETMIEQAPARRTDRDPPTAVAAHTGTGADASAVAAALARAFFDDPLTNYMFPDALARPAKFVMLLQSKIEAAPRGGFKWQKHPPSASCP